MALQALTPDVLAGACAITCAEARKVVAAVHRGEPIERAAGVRRSALDAVRALGYVPTLEVCAVRRSAVDPFVKLGLRTGDGHVVEAVRIPLERAGRFSACVSSQAGCALACTFCATGRLGLARNLQAWEIVEQVRLVRGTLARGQRVHGVVFQGMGEPLANAERVVESIRVMCDPCALAIDARAMTVCTSGLPTGIRLLAREVPKVRLGVSVVSARRDVRRRLMPIDASYPLDEVIDAVIEHARVTGLAPLWAITLLAGVNDTDEDARALADLSRRFAELAGVRPRVSVVPYNAIDDHGRDPFERGDVARFVEALALCGLRAHVRYSGGADVAAACGQLGKLSSATN
ncbi:MAG TPA: radical SAM protein [Polyangiaceae bacterium]|nr:radical SAM protein [Polyangiaceae bacterium]